jgi:hypothetical protein
MQDGEAVTNFFLLQGFSGSWFCSAVDFYKGFIGYSLE